MASQALPQTQNQAPACRPYRPRYPSGSHFLAELEGTIPMAPREGTNYIELDSSMASNPLPAGVVELPGEGTLSSIFSPTDSVSHRRPRIVRTGTEETATPPQPRSSRNSTVSPVESDLSASRSPVSETRPDESASRRNTVASPMESTVSERRSSDRPATRLLELEPAGPEALEAPPPYSEFDPSNASLNVSTPDLTRPQSSRSVRTDSNVTGQSQRTGSNASQIIPDSGPSTPLTIPSPSERTSSSSSYSLPRRPVMSSKAREAGFSTESVHTVTSNTSSTVDITNPNHYARDPRRLTVYLIPFPKPRLAGVDPEKIPERFLIYTPPPPPRTKSQGESTAQKSQRLWEEQVRKAKSTSGLRAKSLRGLDRAMSSTKNSNLEFLNRIPEPQSSSNVDHTASRNPADVSSTDLTHSASESSAASASSSSSQEHQPQLEELLLAHPSNLHLSEDEIRAQFLGIILKAKSKAQRDAVIASGLIPLAAAWDIGLFLGILWPFGGLTQIDSAWTYANVKGAKNSKYLAKRLQNNCTCGKHEHESLKVRYKKDDRLDVLGKYMLGQCYKREMKMFAHPGIMVPSEGDVLTAFGWAPSQVDDDDQSAKEIEAVKADFKSVMQKGAKEWISWCKDYKSNPKKAVKNAGLD